MKLSATGKHVSNRTFAFTSHTCANLNYTHRTPPHFLSQLDGHLAPVGVLLAVHVAPVAVGRHV